MNFGHCNECDFRSGIYYNIWDMELKDGDRLIHPFIFRSRLIERVVGYEEWYITVEKQYRPDSPPIESTGPHVLCPQHIDIPTDPHWVFREQAQVFITDLFLKVIQEATPFQSSGFSVKIVYENLVGLDITHVKVKTFHPYRNMGFRLDSSHEYVDEITDVNQVLDWMYKHAQHEGASRIFNRLCFEIDNHCDILTVKAPPYDFMGHHQIFGRNTSVVHTYNVDNLTSHVTYIFQATHGGWLHLA
jgi:hypothetical protein